MFYYESTLVICDKLQTENSTLISTRQQINSTENTYQGDRNVSSVKQKAP